MALLFGFLLQSSLVLLHCYNSLRRVESQLSGPCKDCVRREMQWALCCDGPVRAVLMVALSPAASC